jgi:hypothetical protein
MLLPASGVKYLPAASNTRTSAGPNGFCKPSATDPAPPRAAGRVRLGHRPTRPGHRPRPGRRRAAARRERLCRPAMCTTTAGAANQAAINCEGYPRAGVDWLCWADGWASTPSRNDIARTVRVRVPGSNPWHSRAVRSPTTSGPGLSRGSASRSPTSGSTTVSRRPDPRWPMTRSLIRSAATSSSALAAMPRVRPSERDCWNTSSATSPNSNGARRSPMWSSSGLLVLRGLLVLWGLLVLRGLLALRSFSARARTCPP